MARWVYRRPPDIRGQTTRHLAALIGAIRRFLALLGVGS